MNFDKRLEKLEKECKRIFEIPASYYGFRVVPVAEWKEEELDTIPDDLVEWKNLKPFCPIHTKYEDVNQHETWWQLMVQAGKIEPIDVSEIIKRSENEEKELGKDEFKRREREYRWTCRCIPSRQEDANRLREEKRKEWQEMIDRGYVSRNIIDCIA